MVNLPLTTPYPQLTAGTGMPKVDQATQALIDKLPRSEWLSLRTHLKVSNDEWFVGHLSKLSYTPRDDHSSVGPEVLSFPN